MVSKSITSLTRYPERRPAGVVPAGDGSLDVDQLWVCWGRRCGFSRTQLLQHIADHAISDSGRRRFLLHSDHDGRTWVTVAAPLRRMPRRHRRGSHRRSPPLRCSAVARPVSRQSHISVSSEDDFVDNDHADISADIQVFMRRTPPVTLQILTFNARTFPLVIWSTTMKKENEVKTEEVLVDAGSVPPTVPDVGSQSCKDETLDSREDALPSAQVFTQSVPSLLFLLWIPGLHRSRQVKLSTVTRIAPPRRPALPRRSRIREASTSAPFSSTTASASDPPRLSATSSPL